MAQHFDVAVIGTQLSGVIAAALVAKRGRRVVLVDHGEQLSHYRFRSLHLPLTPQLVPAFDGSQAMQRVHDALGIGPELRVSTESPQPSFQAVMPRHRLNMWADRQRLVSEIGAEFPEAEAGVRRFFDRLFELDEEIEKLLATSALLAPSTIRERFRARALRTRLCHLDAPFVRQDLMQEIPANHPVREILLAPLSFAGHLWADDPSTLHVVRLLARCYRGTVSFRDRLGSIHRLLMEAAANAGVEIWKGTEVASIKPKGRRLLGFELVDDRFVHTADFFVGNTSGDLSALLPARGRSPRFALEREAVRASGSLLVVNMVVHREVLPCGMAEQVFLFNGRRLARGEEGADPPVFVRVYPVSDGEGELREGALADTSEHVALCCGCPARVAELAHSPERLAYWRRQILERIERLVPFLNDYLRETSLPVETTTWDLEGEDSVRRIDPWAAHPLYETAKKPLLGVAARSPRTYFRNLFHCGHDVMPGLGLEGDYLAGAAAANALLHRARRQWRS